MTHHACRNDAGTRVSGRTVGRRRWPTAWGLDPQDLRSRGELQQERVHE